MQHEYYRTDGVRITHDPFAPGMVEKYGAPGKTDQEGFDPYADSVGAGIYGGRVKRDPDTGNVLVGKQYQNHNPRPGPIYAGGGYAPIADALKEKKLESRLRPLLAKYPDLANDITTGGAQPLHMCGMSPSNQQAVPILVEHGADIEALDTYGMTPLHRMASNNLDIGARYLLEAGADPQNKGLTRSTPMQVAYESRATKVMAVLKEYAEGKMANTPESAIAHNPLHGDKRGIERIEVMKAGFGPVNGVYFRVAASSIPDSFARVCIDDLKADPKSTWAQLNGNGDWYKLREEGGKAKDNGSYIYYNKGDQHWWIDGPSGMGAYKSRGPAHAPPANGIFPSNAQGGWEVLEKGMKKLAQPVLLIFRESHKEVSKTDDLDDDNE